MKYSKLSVVEMLCPKCSHEFSPVITEHQSGRGGITSSQDIIAQEEVALALCALRERISRDLHAPHPLAGLGALGVKVCHRCDLWTPADVMVALADGRLHAGLKGLGPATWRKLKRWACHKNNEAARHTHEMTAKEN